MHNNNNNNKYYYYYYTNIYNAQIIQNRKCVRQQSKAEQISFQFTAKSGQIISQSQFSWKAVPWVGFMNSDRDS